MSNTNRNPDRWYAQDADGEFFLTFFGKRFGTSTFATEAGAREAAILWDRASLAADADEIRFGVQ